MRSPRFIRPHRIVVKNYIGEVEGTAEYQLTEIKYVCVDDTYGIKQSQKGIQADGDLLAIIDMNDLVAFEGAIKRSYIEPQQFETSKNASNVFTLRPNVDFIVYKDKDYTINTITGPNPVSNEPEFLEVIANE